MSVIPSRRMVLGALLGFLGLPVGLAVTEAAMYHVRNRSNGTLVSSGREREYLLYVPPSYDPGRPTPLVISLHGGAMWGAAQRETSQWNRVADRHGFIVVYPSALGPGPRAWAVEPGSDLQRDVRFISELIDTLQATYNIDPARIYANGLSNGGGMSFVLSCTLSDRIAGVGTVAAAQTLPFTWCTDGRPVPLIAFHGTADRQTPYAGGTTWVFDGRWPNAVTWVADWARRNRCAPAPLDSTVAADVRHRAYAGCAGGAAVELYTIVGGGHTWPGGGAVPEWFAGATTQSIDASELMWAFFREHSLPVQ